MCKVWEEEIDSGMVTEVVCVVCILPIVWHSTKAELKYIDSMEQEEMWLFGYHHRENKVQHCSLAKWHSVVVCGTGSGIGAEFERIAYCCPCFCVSREAS